jgi:short-subunit dehydrogenase
MSARAFRLDGRHALVTGASRGIGAALAAAGASRLALVARSPEALDEVAAAAVFAASPAPRR